jgi:putative addiction module component (TIGR02574 family)
MLDYPLPCHTALFPASRQTSRPFALRSDGCDSVSFLALLRLEEGLPLGDNNGVIVEKIPEIKSLSAEQKLILVGELWDDLAAQPGALPPREDHIKLPEQRLDHYHQHPRDTVPWQEVKSHIRSSR